MKYLGEALALLVKEEYAGACKKFWTAASEMTRFVAAMRGLKVRNLRDQWKFVTDLRVGRKEPELVRLFHIANNLRHSAKERVLTREAVIDGAEAVQEYIASLRKQA